MYAAHRTAPHATLRAEFAELVATSALTLRRWDDPVLDATGHRVRSDYVWWLYPGWLGCLATALGQRLALDAEHGPLTLPVADLSLILGLNPHATGHNTPLVRSLARLAHFGLIGPAATPLAVRTRWPSVPRAHQRRLPAIYQALAASLEADR